MNSLGRILVVALFFAFTIGLIYGCAEKPIAFDGPGVQIWRLNIVFLGSQLNEQTLLLKPSETEKDVFHVRVNFMTIRDSPHFGKINEEMKWKGELKNGRMLCDIDYNASVITGPEPQGMMGTGTAKGTFSERRASGTLKIQWRMTSSGTWTAERIS